MRGRRTVLGVAILLALWALAAAALRMPALPGPLPVTYEFLRGLLGPLGRHLLASAARVFASIVLAGLVAIPAGLLLGQSRFADRLFSPLIYLLHPIPKVVFLPIVLVLLGVGDLAKIVLIALVLVFQILVVVRDAAANLPKALVDSVRSLGASHVALLRFVYLPACLPSVLTGLKLGASTAVAVLFFAESFATRAGLGYYIFVDSWGRLAYTEMYAGVLAMSLLGLLMYSLFEWLERRLCPYLYLH